jgi:hypothetical protein
MVPTTRFAIGVLLLLVVRGDADNTTASDPPLAHAALSTEGGSRGTITLLRMPVVRDELKLSREQVKDVEDLHIDMVGALRRQRLRRGDSSEPEATPAQLQASVAKIMAEHHRLAAEQLTEQQKSRLDQLFVRYLRAQALSHPAVVRKLQITPEQLTAIREASQSPQPKMQELLRLLSAEQQQQFNRLQGPVFEFPERTPNAVMLK